MPRYDAGMSSTPPPPTPPSPPASPSQSPTATRPGGPGGADSAGGPAALQAPWRLEYLQALDAKEKVAGPPAAGSGSFLLDYWRAPERDVANHVIVRTGAGLILLNAFPYANGHLLVAHGEAKPSLLDYDAGERAGLWGLVEVATDVLQRGLQPQGINIGINQGRAAGAGVPQHLHVHLVPRWGGDVNFITTIGQVRVIPSSLEAMAAKLRETARAMGIAGAVG